MILGVFPAVILVLIALFLILIIPYMIYKSYKEKRLATAEARKKDALILALYRTKWSPE